MIDTTQLALGRNDKFFQQNQKKTVIFILLGVFLGIALVTHGFAIWYLSQRLITPAIILFCDCILSIFVGVVSFISNSSQRQTWQNIITKREQAYKNPEAFFVEKVNHSEELPKPLYTATNYQYKKLPFLTLPFIVVVWLTLQMIMYPERSLLFWLFLIVLYTVLILIYAFFFRWLVSNQKKREKQKDKNKLNKIFPNTIDIDEEGIKTRFNAVESQLSWQDARLFTVYLWKFPFLINLTHAPIQIFELAGEQEVVRWHDPASMRQDYRINQAQSMSPEELERWTEQLNSFVAAKTGLPLIRLDSGTGTSSDNHPIPEKVDISHSPE